MNCVLIVLTQPFNPNDGGVQRTSFKMGSYFSANGFKVSYFSFASGGHIAPDFATLYHTEHKGESRNSLNIKKFKEVILECRPDIVINQMPYDKGIRNSLHKIRAESKFVLLGCLRNSLFSFKSNLQDKINFLIPKSVRWVVNNKVGLFIIEKYHIIKHSRELKAILDIHDFFVLLTPSNIKELDYFIGNYKSEKLFVIPNSIPEVKQIEIPKEKILLHVGRINIPQKRSDLLLPVWKDIVKKVEDWKFLIVGDGPYMEILKSEILKYNIPRIELVGYQKPEEYYARASIFMMTSAYEGFPNVIIEAQSFGNIPVVMDSYYALNDIVNDNLDAILCTPFDTKEMAEKISSLMNDQKRIYEMTLASYKNAEQFTIDRVGKKWVEFFNSFNNKSGLENED